MITRLSGVPVEDLEESAYGYFGNQQIGQATANGQAVHEDELLAEDKRGRAILRLRAEREGLLNSIWREHAGTNSRTLDPGDRSSGLCADRAGAQALAIEPVKVS